ncbi:N-acetylmuramoyl-L-alanine amidase [uncultured Muribaculum sp.]|uniref:N-acetylmuramoyl-L-alanine amidase family protein n=1 Tax=uncultured Muribaculum sp. TaxID=1918613 RepID=UPI00266F8F0C|nr:N-acetylmuramoyl-L-alanine amidase [uncultured Muribaculum sp.]
MPRAYIIKIILLLTAVVAHTTLAATTESHKFTLVIDAGHGGHDYGAVAGKINEKSINLATALEFGRLVESNMPDVKIVYTRKGDYFKTLQERASIANKANGNLFVSIHTNSVDKRNKRRTTIHGASTYTLGLHRSEENFAVAQRENSVMMLEDDYETKYLGFDPSSTESYIIFELSHDKNIDQSIDFAAKVQKQLSSTAGRADKGVRQAGFWVLAKTSMPAVLVELDFICNPNCAAFLNSKQGTQKMGKALYNAFCQYRKSYQADSVQPPLTTNTEQPADTASATAHEPEQENQNTESDEIIYKVQFLTSPTKLHENSEKLKGIKQFDFYIDNGTYKYTTGNHPTINQAKRSLRNIKDKFPDAFIIKTSNGKRVK